MSKQGHFFQPAESTHRRTYSNNLENLKGIKAGHRRTMSNTAFDFAGLNIQSPPLTQETPTTASKSITKTSSKKSKSFLSLINAAVSYFKQEAQFPIIFPPSEIDILKEQLDFLRSTQKELEKGNSKLAEDCEKHKILLENQSRSKKNLENVIVELKKSNMVLENSLKKINLEIKVEQKRGEDLVFFMSEQEKIRSSPQNMAVEEIDRKVKRKHVDNEKPTPKPINYKPLTQRGLRNSRDISKK